MNMQSIGPWVPARGRRVAFTETHPMVPCILAPGSPEPVPEAPLQAPGSMPLTFWQAAPPPGRCRLSTPRRWAPSRPSPRAGWGSTTSSAVLHTHVQAHPRVPAWGRVKVISLHHSLHQNDTKSYSPFLCGPKAQSLGGHDAHL